MNFKEEYLILLDIQLENSGIVILRGCRDELTTRGKSKTFFFPEKYMNLPCRLDVVIKKIRLAKAERGFLRRTERRFVTETRKCEIERKMTISYQNVEV